MCRFKTLRFERIRWAGTMGWVRTCVNEGFGEIGGTRSLAQ